MFLFSAGFLFPGKANAHGEPVARFLFNSTFENTPDTNRNISLVGVMPAADRFGNKDCAYYLHGGPKSYINLGTDSILKPKEGSISIWFKIDNIVYSGKGYPVNPIILTKSHSGNDFYEGYSLTYQYDLKKLGFCTGHVNETDTLHANLHTRSNIDLRKWYHVVMTWDYDSIRLYINGEPECAIRRDFSSQYLQGDSVMLGHTANVKNQRFFNGFMDDVEIYDRVISPLEVLELYNSPNPNRYQAIMFGFIAILFTVGLILCVFWLVFMKNKDTERKKGDLQNQLYEMELRMMKAQINPHFISNSLTAVQQLILNNQTERANQYVAKCSLLIRYALKFTDKFLSPLEEELRAIDIYIELEQLRFENKFLFEKKLNPDVNPAEILVPPLITQPIIENAIWHGLLPLKEERTPKLSLTIEVLEDNLLVSVTDNGVGRNLAQHKNKDSKGTKLISGWINNINRISGGNNKARIEFIDLVDEKFKPSGTKVNILLPVIKQNQTDYENNKLSNCG